MTVERSDAKDEKERRIRGKQRRSFMEQLLLNYEPRYYRTLLEFVEKKWIESAFLLNLTLREMGDVVGIGNEYKKAPHIGEANYYLLSIERELIETQ